MLPKDWRLSTLGQIARVTSGGTPSRAEPSYWGGSIPWVTTGEIGFNTITDTTEKITEAALKGSSAKLFARGTLLMAMYGQGKTRGQMAKLGIEAATFDFNLERVSPRWLLHHVTREEFYRGHLGLANGGRKARRVSPSDLLRVEILVPDLREQQAIADVIDTACAEEKNLEKQVNALRVQKSVLTADLLTGKRRVRSAEAHVGPESAVTAG
jgi:type I restriction enzyme S subunit